MFDNIKPLDLQWERRKKQIWIALAIVIVLAPIVYYELKNWPEEQTAKTFLTALEQEQYQEAYTLWKPAPSYKLEDFLADWGKQSPLGKINNFKITKSHERGSGVIVTVSINENKEARIWVEKKDKSLGFPPY